jgi:hypothetical protein
MPRNIPSLRINPASDGLPSVQITYSGLLIALPALGAATTPNGLMYFSRVPWSVGMRTRVPDIENEVIAL